MIQETIVFLNRNAGALTVLFGAIVAAATVVYALLTASLVRETRRMRRAQTEPDVVVRLQPTEAWINFIEIVIENNGAGGAQKLRFDVSPDIECSSGQMLSSIGLFKYGLRRLAPRQQIKTFLFSIADKASAIADPDGPFRFTVTVSYESASGERCERHFELDLLHLIGMGQLGTPPLKDLANSLKAIQKDVHQLSTGLSRLHVNTYSPDQVVQEEAEQFAAFRSRKADEEEPPSMPAARDSGVEPTDKVHHQALESAFLQLSFAMKLWHFVRDGGLQRESFDIELAAVDDRGVPYVMLEGEFHSDDDLVLAAENNISICFAAAAITLWEAIREHSGLESKQLTPTTSERQRIAGLAFAIRCCFAHGTAAPRWELTKKYQVLYEFPGLVVDLTSKQGLPFDYSDLGGPDGLRQLRRLAASAGLI